MSKKIENTVNETLLIEELKSLLEGKTIDFLDLEEGIKIKINGKDFKDHRFEFLHKVLNMSSKRFELMFNILDRYDNEEYWEVDIIGNEEL